MIYTHDKESIKANFRNARVLVVEDNNDYWVLIQRAMLEILPEVRPIRAASRQQAQQMLAKWSRDEWDMPKLVLLDLYLPERDQGWQVLSDIRNLSAPCNSVPVVVLSSSDGQLDISESYSRGSSAYVVKPTAFSDWLDYFRQLRNYWWETVRLPLIRPTF